MLRVLYAVLYDNSCNTIFSVTQPLLPQLPHAPGAMAHGNAVTSEFLEGQLLPDDVHDGFYYALLEKTG